MKQNRTASLAKNLRTISQACGVLPAFTEATIRWWIFTDLDGFKKVVVKIGRRVYLDMEKLDLWLEDQRVTQEMGESA